MKNLMIICLSLSMLLGRLQPDHYQRNIKSKVPAVLHQYWFKKTRKEVLRYDLTTNPLYRAIGNSLHFIRCGSLGRMIPF